LNPVFDTYGLGLGQFGGNTGKLDVAGDVYISGKCEAGSFLTLSDYRIKENVLSLDSLTQMTIDNLRPVKYTNKITRRNDIGLIAHELQEHYPFLVMGEKDGEKNQSVNYTGLIGLLIKEIQQLKKRVAILEHKDAAPSLS
jgi:hypothetical protein